MHGTDPQGGAAKSGAGQADAAQSFGREILPLGEGFEFPCSRGHSQRGFLSLHGATLPRLRGWGRGGGQMANHPSLAGISLDWRGQFGREWQLSYVSEPVSWVLPEARERLVSRHDRP